MAPTPRKPRSTAPDQRHLRACVASWSPAHREIIQLVYYQRRGVEEAGANHPAFPRAR